ncbi:MAG: hypothetical protein ACXW2E_00500 [Nitrososphaeraceae archaeon]
MKTHLIKTKNKNGNPTWHYELATLANIPSNRRCMSICEYIRKVTEGIGIMALIIVLLGFISGIIADFLLWIYTIVTIAWIPPHALAVVLIIGLFVCSVFFIVVGCGHLIKYLGRKTKDQIESCDSLSFVKHTYESIKNKTCFEIKLEK